MEHNEISGESQAQRLKTTVSEKYSIKKSCEEIEGDGCLSHQLYKDG